MNTPLFSKAQRHSPAEQHRSDPQKVMAVLSVCMALQMTGYVMTLPLFARRFSELGAGVKDLGTSAIAAALTATLAAPFMGALADRFGRRRLTLVSLAVYLLAHASYLFASSAPAFILLRGLAGIFTAGLIPAVIGVVADLAPRERRAQWIGIVNGGASVGWIAGPILGGVIYDHWGYNTAILASIGMGLVTILIAALMVPETRPNPVNSTDRPTRKGIPFQPRGLKSGLRPFLSTLPRPSFHFAFLLWTFFAVMFSWAFIESRFMFYAYEDLGWSSSMLGLEMSAYGVALAVGEFGLSQLSDRLGRKPVILLGLLLFSAQFIGMAFFQNYLLIAVTFVIAGLGNALYDPALSASLLDIAPAEHQGRILGIKSAANSLGSIAGPALFVMLSASMSARGVFLTAVGLALLTALVGLLVKLEPRSSRRGLISNASEEETFTQNVSEGA